MSEVLNSQYLCPEVDSPSYISEMKHRMLKNQEHKGRSDAAHETQHATEIIAPDRMTYENFHVDTSTILFEFGHTLAS